jgi:hypothetical protein
LRHAAGPVENRVRAGRTEKLQLCTYDACDSNACENASTVDWNACLAAAQSGACASDAASVNTACAVDAADGGALDICSSNTTNDALAFIYKTCGNGT